MIELKLTNHEKATVTIGALPTNTVGKPIWTAQGTPGPAQAIVAPAPDGKSAVVSSGSVAGVTDIWVIAQLAGGGTVGDAIRVTVVDSPLGLSASLPVPK